MSQLNSTGKQPHIIDQLTSTDNIKEIAINDKLIRKES